MAPRPNRRPPDLPALTFIHPTVHTSGPGADVNALTSGPGADVNGLTSGCRVRPARGERSGRGRVGPSGRAGRRSVPGDPGPSSPCRSVRSLGHRARSTASWSTAWNQRRLNDCATVPQRAVRNTSRSVGSIWLADLDVDHGGRGRSTWPSSALGDVATARALDVDGHLRPVVRKPIVQRANATTGSRTQSSERNHTARLPSESTT